MCGIVGLFLKDKSLEPKLGEMLSGMLTVMCDRGPDSAGFAVYGAGQGTEVKLTLRSSDGQSIDGLKADLEKALGLKLNATQRDTHLVVAIPSDKEEATRVFLSKARPDVKVVGAGQRMELFKEVGLPSDVADRFGLSAMSGTHGIGHTRMATESAVTTNGAHPFSTGADQCLVHNGSLSNHNAVRRTLVREGVSIETENDSEVAAGYLTWKMRDGASLKQALESSLDDLDGFYTFVVGTETGFAVLRDPIACKPAVMAETDGYVAFGSEYRALAGLPGIETARVWEPEPATVYAWERQ
ncbi:glutamine amidotransferase [Terrihabitans soli]|uniref:Glutamine amidotransferase n=1 Tax=Terrihabitans soli TaxID=708113 RepID=A0A6S6QT71_9HYPH|nr:glutamine amidotransferase family protein [Terrihabitans soli]BCJ92299.1 glutamine amidotransferase [Terrihabitans soli]